jgi:DNA-binding NtrC family response regulator
MRESILVVTPDHDDIRVVQSAAAEQSAETVVAHTYREALGATAKKTISLIFCQEGLPDGNWKDLLSRIVVDPEPPRLVVMAEPSDQALWAEAISLGAYDVIAKPVDIREAQHVISGALLMTRQTAQGRAKPTDLPAVRRRQARATPADRGTEATAKGR